MADVRAVLADIDGVLAVSWEPLPGAAEAMARIRSAGLPVLLLTNTTSRTRASIAATLTDAGLPVEADEILTAPAMTAAWLRENHPARRCLLLSHGDVAADLEGVKLARPDGMPPDVVVLGGAGPEFAYEDLNRVFRDLQRGVPLVAMHRNLSWQTSAGLQLDTGAFLLGLERAAGVEATVLGKPSPEFFLSALRRLGVDAEHALMIGDDVESDVLGAQANGITGVLVRTGKYRPGVEETADGKPDHVLDSFADLPGLLGLS